MPRDVYITLDIDWAPDYMLDFVLKYLTKYNIKATWFITHKSRSVDEIISNHDLFDSGIHPNFQDNSSQGKNIDEVINFFNIFLPNATSMRTHSYVQSWNILEKITKNSNIKIDLSYYSPRIQKIERTMYFYDNNSSLIRIPTFWEDHLEIFRPDKDWEFNCIESVEGPIILNFHPVHIYCNTIDVNDYNEIKPYIKEKGKVEEYIDLKRKGFGPFFSFLKIIQNKEYFSCRKISDLI